MDSEQYLLDLLLLDKPKGELKRIQELGLTLDDLYEFGEAQRNFDLRNKRLKEQFALAIDGDFMCRRCNSNKYTTYRQLQTRRGDEAMTTKIYCKNCRITWQE